jgi:hypothetical protein
VTYIFKLWFGYRQQTRFYVLQSAKKGTDNQLASHSVRKTGNSPGVKRPNYEADHLLLFDVHMFVHRNVITNYSQPEAKFLEFIYFYRRSTCFRRFLHPSSGAYNCRYSFRYCQPKLLLVVTVVEMELSQFHLHHGSS